MREIGSEFWIEKNPKILTTERDGLYVLSGRTAIDCIIQDILQSKPARSVYMPGYCCDSMIEPFRNRGIRVNLYDVWFDGRIQYEVDLSEEVDVFYVTNYFGYENTLSEEIVRSFKEKGCTIIYDRTHSFFMQEDILVADYTFASIRKWMGVVGGAVVKGITDTMLKECPYIQSKAVAMREKYQYLVGDTTIDKESFLNSFGQFGQNLASDYRDYRMDDLSYTIYQEADLLSIRERRRTNAQYLLDNIDILSLGVLTAKSCPLFVPVVFESKEERDKMRSKLIAHQIYCPIHWPKNMLVEDSMKVNAIYDRELSLICDQRYDLSDMEKIVETIKK